MTCEFKYISESNGKYLHRCANCQHERLSNYQDSTKIHRQCKSDVVRFDHAIKCPPSGVGTELTAMFKQVDLKPKKSCGCQAKAAQMDLWGVDGCRESFATIVEWMEDAYSHCSYWELGKAASLATFKGLPKTIPGFIREAIGRAEAKGHIRPPLKIGFLTPSLLLGGAERWIASLARHFDTGIIWPKYVFVIEHQARSPIVVGWLPKYTTVLPATELPKYAPDLDALISWGTSDLPTRCPQPRKYQLIDVQHGTALNAFGKVQYDLAQAAVAAEAHITAVGEACIPNFPMVNQANVTVIENGAETDRLQPIEGREATRAKYGIDPAAKVVLFIGRFSPVKNLAGLASAMKCLPDWKLIAAGPQYQSHPVLHALGEQAIILPAQEHLGDLFAAADVFCAPSHHEANSIALSEALLAGVPCVVTEYPAIQALHRRHGPLAFTVPLKPSGEVLAAGIEAAYGADVSRAKAVCREHYTGEAMATRWTKYIREKCHVPA